MESILAHCSAAFAQHGGLFAVFFVGGLTGGFTHCLAMCGPLVASEMLGCRSACAASCQSRRAVLGRASGLMYHLGRATTYGALGFLAALLSKQLTGLAFWPQLSALMLAVAGAMFIASSLPGCAHRTLPATGGGALTYLKGLLLGFMPCGMLYAALMMAASLASPVSGMLAMWAFALGTLPALLIASGSAALVGRRWQHITRAAGRVMMAFNGLSLLVMAARVVR